MKTSSYRPSWAFQVTTSVPCPLCNTFKPESEVIERRQYLYGAGYFTLKSSCKDCFTKAYDDKKAEIAKTDERNLGNY